MLGKQGKYSVAFLIGLALISGGCMENTQATSVPADNLNSKLESRVILELSKPALLQGAAEFRARLRNEGARSICVGPNLSNSIVISIVEAGTGNPVYDEGTNIGAIEGNVRAPSDSSLTHFSGNAQVLEVGKEINFVRILRPLIDPYTVGNNNRYVRDLPRNARLEASAGVYTFDCAYANLNAALRAEDFIKIDSNEVPIGWAGNRFIVR